MIRWIIEGKFGTAPYSDIKPEDDLLVVDIRDLVDKPGNTPELIKKKIDAALQGLQSGKKTVLCCDYGISRSNALAAGVLSRFENISLHDAISKVMEATGETNIKVDVLTLVRKALEGDARAKSSNDLRRILVAGGSGFIGQSLVKALSKNNQMEIFSPSSKEIDLLNNPVALDLYVCDQNIDTLIHLANPRVYTSNRATGDIVVMMRNILDVCHNNDIKIFYLSSWEVFSGIKESGIQANEFLSPNPKGPYGEGKFLAEKLLEQFHSNYGVRYCLIRSGPVYGPGSDRPKFIFNFWDKAKKGEDISFHEYLNGYPALDLLHKDDLMAGLMLLIENDCEGIYHLGGNNLCTTQEIAALLVELNNSPSKIGPVSIQDTCANIQMDFSKICKEFGWAPKIGFRQGLESVLTV